GASDDANHMVAPLESGAGMVACIRAALADAGIEPDVVDYVSAHGTSTHANDSAETKALHTVFGEHAKDLAITGVKSQIGHLLGASGGVSSVFAALTLESGMVPGTINLENPDPECDLNYMADGSKKLDPRVAIVNALGFGGTNACLVLKKFSE
ncbi:MAG: beta-ketoacyl-[Mailhella sp.]|nr:beta-ketoacyl-[acyl-carrier-protein] synthase II [Mailhella sp.]